MLGGESQGFQGFINNRDFKVLAPGKLIPQWLHNLEMFHSKATQKTAVSQSTLKAKQKVENGTKMFCDHFIPWANSLLLLANFY